MKNLLLILCVTLFTQYTTFAQSEFDLKPDQSMLMTGKGQGQDGAKNPYLGQDCYAIVENLGKTAFSIRVQQKGTIIETIPITSKEVKKVTLLKGYELYLDTNSLDRAQAKVDFIKKDE